jgi:S-phase kinase-associated protein 1
MQGLDLTDNSDITIICNDGKKVAVPKNVANKSALIKGSLDKDADATEVTLQHIDSPIVELAMKYCKHHVDDEKIPEIVRPLKSNKIENCVGKWDAEFVNGLEQETLFRLLLAVNYMDIQGCVELICAKIASLMKGKTPQAIRSTFGIRDFTPSEKEEIAQNFPDLVN